MHALDLSPTRLSRQAGFTFVELIMVVVIVGALAVFATPRMFNVAEFREQGFTDELRAALRLAQKSAVAANCPVTFTITATHYSAVFTCAAANVPSPKGDAGGLAGDVPDGSGITMTPAVITFDAVGRRTSADSCVTVSGETSPINVSATGFVQ